MTNHLVENVQNFLIVEEIDFIESLEQTSDLSVLVIDLNMKIAHYKKILIITVKQSKYDLFDTMNIDSRDIDKK